MFLDNLNFSKLIKPKSKSEFFDTYFDKKTLLIKRHNKDFYQGLLSPEQLDEVLFQWPNDATLVKASEHEGNRQNLHASVYQNNTATVINALDEGSTLILDKLDHRIPSLTQLNGSFEKELHYPFQSNVYITPPKSQGFKAHFDNHHVFILQTTGSKLWRVDNNAKPHSTSSDKALDYTIDPDNHQAFLLEQGDLIYIPPYTVHEAEGQNEYSVHITLSPYPPSWRNLLSSVLDEQQQGTSPLNDPIPHGFLDRSPQELTTHLQQLLGTVIKQLDDAHSENYLKTRADDFRGVFRGALQHRMEANVISTEQKYCLNQSLLIREREQDDELILITPKKEVSIPLLFAEEVRFCLSGQSFHYNDLVDLVDEEKNILINRLLSEGLIVKSN